VLNIVFLIESYAVYQVTLSSQNQFGWSDSVTKTFRTDAGVNNGNGLFVIVSF